MHIIQILLSKREEKKMGSRTKPKKMTMSFNAIENQHRNGDPKKKKSLKERKKCVWKTFINKSAHSSHSSSCKIISLIDMHKIKIESISSANRACSAAHTHACRMRACSEAIAVSIHKI